MKWFNIIYLVIITICLLYPAILFAQQGNAVELRILAKISPELYEKSVQTPSAKIPVWVEFIDRPFKNDPLQYIEYVKTHSYLPPVNEAYVQNLISLPNVEFLGTSELTNELGILIPAENLFSLAEQSFVTRIEEMPKLVPEEYLPDYSIYQGVYYNAIDLRELQEQYSGYDPLYQSGDTLGKHIKLTILDTGIYPYHPVFWNSEIKLTQNTAVNLSYSIAASDSFIHLVIPTVDIGLYYKRSRDFGINWNQGSQLSAAMFRFSGIATSGNNVYIVATIDQQRDVFLWRSNNNGNSWQGPQNLTNYPANKRTKNPTVSAQGDMVYVTWDEWEDLTNPPYYWTRVQFRRSLDQGANFNPISLIADTDTTLSYGLDVASENQDVHITWSQRDPERLRYRNSNNQGSAWNAIQERVCADSVLGRAAIAASGGNAHIAFELEKPPTPPYSYNIYYWRPQGNIATQLTTEGSSQHPAIAAAGRYIYVSWDESDTTTGIQIYFKRHRNFGVTNIPWDDGDEFTGNNNSDITKRISYGNGFSFNSAITATDSIANHIRMVHIVWLDTRPGSEGIYYSSSSKIFAWRDYQNSGNLIPRDYGRHGTAVSSVASGCLANRTETNNDFNPYIGVAWQGILAVAHTELEAQDIQAIKWATDTLNTDVINLSGGYGQVGIGTSRIAQYLDWATAKGKVFIKSAGNNGPGPGTLTIPADNFNAITVGATNYNGTGIANFSSRGPTADGRIKPDVVAPGEDIYLADTNMINSLYRTGSGTSFAAPMVAGVCALLLEANPNLTPGAIRKALRNTAVAVTGNPRPNNNEGWGIIQAWAARNYNVNNFPPEIIPTAIPYPNDSFSAQQGDSVTLWIWVKDRECSNTPRATVNLSSIGGPADTIMSGNWVANQWLRCSVRVRINPTAPTGRKYLKVTASEGPNDDRDTVWAYININITSAPGIEEVISQIKYPVLFAPKPNPFTNRTEIRFQIPTKTNVELKVYNSIGQMINTLIADEMKPGYCTITWDGKNKNGHKVAEGIYFCQLETDEFQMTKKMLMLR